MAVKINVGFSRKVGEPNYGSRGASVHLEVELDRRSLDDSERFHREIEGFFERARDAVDLQLKRNVPLAPGSRPSDREGDHQQPNGLVTTPRPATASQIRAMQSIARHRGVDLNQLLREKFDVKTTEQLTVVAASLLIDHIKSFPNPSDVTPSS